MTDEPLAYITTPAEPQPVPPLVLLPEHAGASHFSLQHLSGVATLVLIFFASASITLAYLSSGGEVAAAGTQTAAAAAVADPFEGLSLQAEGAYVYDLTTRRTLYAKNASAQLPLASLVKVPLVLAVSEVLKPDEYITVPPHEMFDGTEKRLPEGLSFRTADL